MHLNVYIYIYAMIRLWHYQLRKILPINYMFCLG